MSVADRSSKETRSTFLSYFAARGHEVVGSSSLVPANDPTLLFTNAGMNQFKDVFTGATQRERRRATSAQKCVRAGGKHNDLDNVGRTARHHTFFEMLGNFSFGDYFKKEAIEFAHELITREYGVDARRLVYTVHESDAEARALWRRIADVPDDRVISLGDKDNFWAMGETGPCGPCSEIHFHQGDDVSCAEEAAGRSCQGPACDCDRWVEIWNLVFMQFEQLADKSRRPLPRPSVDTGMGLERMNAVLRGLRSTYETDLLRPLVAEVEAASGKRFVADDYAENAPSVSMRAIADHARATAFLIAEGVFPDKTGREYVLRRIMRRAVYHSWLIGVRKPILAGLAGRVVEEMGDVYPELRERRSTIAEVTDQEERRFRETLDRGLRILEEETTRLGGKQIPGDLAFRLYDTYGFPMDLTRVIAEGRGLTVDEAGFEAKMDEQRRRGEFVGSGDAAVDAVFHKVAERVGPTRFLGYDTTTARSEVVALVAGGQEVQQLSAQAAGSGAAAVILRETPFYGEQGGQIGDTGTARGPRGVFKICDTRRPVSTLYVHSGALEAGELRVGDTVELAVDVERRDAIRRNHSATHLLHLALRKVLGDHVAQKGSLVAPDRLRFDFSHFQPLAAEEKSRVEDLVNAAVLANVAAVTEVLPIAEARRAGAIAFFGEKYGDTVRVLTLGDSKELCGGTHVSRTGDIGLFKITEETGVAQGVRRLEAVTGAGAVAHVRRLEQELALAAEQLRSAPLEVASRIARQQLELRDREREIGRLKAQIASGGTSTGGGGGPESQGARQIGKYHLLVRDVGVADPKVLRDAADKLRIKLDPGVLVLAGAADGKVALVCAVTPGAQDRFDAGQIVKMLGEDLGWKGGGRKDLAQGGGALPAGRALQDILEGWRAKVEEHVAAAR
jgi:alanyl-tRNA synthetase